MVLILMLWGTFLGRCWEPKLLSLYGKLFAYAECKKNRFPSRILNFSPCICKTNGRRIQQIIFKMHWKMYVFNVLLLSLWPSKLEIQMRCPFPLKLSWQPIEVVTLNLKLRIHIDLEIQHSGHRSVIVLDNVNEEEVGHYSACASLATG